MSRNKDKAPLKVKITYRFDAFLMHLVQETTRRSSAEILNFFHELAKQVSEIGTEKRTGDGIRKNIVEYFPGTSIPFQMVVKGYKRNEYDHVKKQYVDNSEHMLCRAEIGFPEQKVIIKQQALDDIAVSLMEKALLGGEEVNLGPFVRPDIKTPKMYKALMDAFIRKKD